MALFDVLLRFDAALELPLDDDLLVEPDDHRAEPAVAPPCEA